MLLLETIAARTHDVVHVGEAAAAVADRDLLMQSEQPQSDLQPLYGQCLYPARAEQDMSQGQLCLPPSLHQLHPERQ